MVFEHDYKNFPELTNQQINDFGFSSPFKQITEDFTARVVRVHDGDTITVQTDFRDFNFPIRFLDIDAPELNEGGGVARDWLSQRLLNEEVMVMIDYFNRVGKYGRLLGRVVHNGFDAGQDDWSITRFPLWMVNLQYYPTTETNLQFLFASRSHTATILSSMDTDRSV